jgi:hypothetical protein
MSVPYTFTHLTTRVRRLQKIGGGPLIKPTPKNNAIFGVIGGLLGLPFLHLVKAPSLLWIPVLYVFAAILVHKILMGVWFPWGHSDLVGDVEYGDDEGAGPKF